MEATEETFVGLIVERLDCGPDGRLPVPGFYLGNGPDRSQMRFNQLSA